MTLSPPSSRWFAVVIGALIASVVLALGGLPGFDRHALAAELVTIDSQTVACDGITVTYTVTAAAPEDSALLYAYHAADVVGFTTGDGSSGAHTVLIPVSPVQPGGTPLHARVEVGAASDESAPEACSGGTIEEPPPPDSPPPEAPPEDWAGFSDGRLNPSRDEYYSVYCHYDFIEVWRAVPSGLLVLNIPIIDVMNMDEGASLDVGQNMTVVRNSSDTITIYGSNGNLAPAPGSKAFSLSECIARNGGAPTPDDVLPSETSPGGSEEPSSPDNQTCYDISATPAEYVECMRTPTSLPILEVIWAWLIENCGLIPGIVLVPAGAWTWRKRRKTRG